MSMYNIIGKCTGKDAIKQITISSKTNIYQKTNKYQNDVIRRYLPKG